MPVLAASGGVCAMQCVREDCPEGEALRHEAFGILAAECRLYGLAASVWPANPVAVFHDAEIRIAPDAGQSAKKSHLKLQRLNVVSTSGVAAKECSS